MGSSVQSTSRGNSSQKKLLDAFISLLRSKSYEQITISDICREADMNRKTFYRNFTQKEDLIYFLIDELFISYISDDEGIGNSPNAMTHFLTFYRDKHELMGLLSQNRLLFLFISYATEYSHRDVESYSDYRKYHWDMDFIVAGTINVYERWRKENFTTPVEVIVEELKTTFSGCSMFDDMFFSSIHSGDRRR